MTRWYEQLNRLGKIGKKRQETDEHKNNFQTFRRGGKKKTVQKRVKGVGSENKSLEPNVTGRSAQRRLWGTMRAGTKVSVMRKAWGEGKGGTAGAPAR